MNVEAVTYSWRGASKKAPLMGAACLVVSIYVACVAIFRPHHLSAGRATAAAVIAAAFFSGALGLQVDHLYTIDPKAGRVSRLTTFFGLAVWKKHWSLNEFSSVNTYRLKAGTPRAPIDMIYVGLMKTSGSTLAIKYFQAGRGRSCRAAEEFASDLQRVVGVPPVT